MDERPKGAVMAVQTVAEVKLSIPAHADYIDVARLSLYGVAVRAGFSYEEIEDMKVALSEACNNVVLHAYPDRTGEIELRFELKDDALTIRIRDSGASFASREAVESAASLHDKDLQEVEEGGLGLYLMQALMDEVRVTSGSGTEVMMTKLRR